MQAESEKLLLVGDHWSSSEVDEAAFRDVRLGRRFGDLLRRLSDRMGGTIPLACQDWASTKAAYRFFSNPKVEEGDILAGHLEATKARCAGPDGTDLGDSGYDRVHLSAPEPARRRLYQKRKQWSRQKWPTPPPCGLRYTYAFQSRCHRGGTSSRTGRGQILEPR
ncbi:IS4/Tn5 family transposase DNA-binding protein [Sphingomonas sp. UYP23]